MDLSIKELTEGFVMARWERAGDQQSLVACIEQKLVGHLSSIFEKVSLRKDFLIFLVERGPLPKISGWVQLPVHSFICAANIFDRFQHENFAPEEWAYQMLEAVYDLRIEPPVLQVLQVPFDTVDETPVPKRELPFNVIIPHRGSISDLKACLTSLENNLSAEIVTHVCFDQPVDELTEKELLGLFTNLKTYKIDPWPAGPYVIRQKLIDELNDGFILYQDSDDLSTSDRVEKITAALHDGFDLVGSHELRFDQIEQKILAVRYPLDVYQALTTKPAFPLLHSTGAMSLKSFLKVGGYSTNRAFANDTQFLLRCYFFLRIKNVDEFLYIRKIHRHSLTTDPNHPLDGNVREAITSEWNADFIEVRQNLKQLDESSLRVVPHEKYEQFRLSYSLQLSDSIE